MTRNLAFTVRNGHQWHGRTLFLPNDNAESFISFVNGRPVDITVVDICCDITPSLQGVVPSIPGPGHNRLFRERGICKELELNSDTCTYKTLCAFVWVVRLSTMQYWKAQAIIHFDCY